LASLGHPRKFQQVSCFGFITAATLLNGVNQTLHDVWSSSGLVHNIYIFLSSCPLTEFCHMQNSPRVQLLAFSYWQCYYSTPAEGVSQTLWHGKMKLRNFRTWRHLYSAGRPSRWASAHIFGLMSQRSSAYDLPGLSCRPLCKYQSDTSGMCSENK